jgi:hypothetical protein
MRVITVISFASIFLDEERAWTAFFSMMLPIFLILVLAEIFRLA